MKQQILWQHKGTLTPEALAQLQELNETEIIEGAGTLEIYGVMYFRPGDTFAVIERILYHETDDVLDLSVNLYGASLQMLVQNPRDFTLGADFFSIGQASSVKIDNDFFDKNTSPAVTFA